MIKDKEFFNAIENFAESIGKLKHNIYRIDSNAAMLEVNLNQQYRDLENRIDFLLFILKINCFSLIILYIAILIKYL